MSAVTMQELEDYLNKEIRYWSDRFDQYGSNGALNALGALERVRKVIKEGLPPEKKCPTCGRKHD